MGCVETTICPDNPDHNQKSVIWKHIRFENTPHSSPTIHVWCRMYYYCELKKGKNNCFSNLKSLKVVSQTVQPWKWWPTDWRMDSTKSTISLLRVVINNYLFKSFWPLPYTFGVTYKTWRFGCRKKTVIIILTWQLRTLISSGRSPLVSSLSWENFTFKIHSDYWLLTTEETKT